MADCTAPTLSVPTLGCFDNPQTWAGDLVQEMQDAIDHLVGCIVDFEYPQCDICVMKSDLVDCPLAANMMDFATITWGEDGGQGVMPLPPNLGDLDFRYGTGQTECTGEGYPTDTIVITFDTPFDTECLFADVVYGEATDCCEGSSGGINVIHMYSALVRNITAAGFTFWPCDDSFGISCKVSYRYFALGR